ncbi:hypothetical protein MRX96_014923 [Rhipicephalus microplus]
MCIFERRLGYGVCVHIACAYVRVSKSDSPRATSTRGSAALAYTAADSSGSAGAWHASDENKPPGCNVRRSSWITDSYEKRVKYGRPPRIKELPLEALIIDLHACVRHRAEFPAWAGNVATGMLCQPPLL